MVLAEIKAGPGRQPFSCQLRSLPRLFPPLENKQGIEDEDDYENKPMAKPTIGQPYRAGVVRDLHLTAHRLRRKNQQHQSPACSNVPAPPL